MAELQSSCG